MLMDTLEIILCIALIAVCVYMLVHFFVLRHQLLVRNAKIESCRQLILEAKISSEHVGEEQLLLANKNAELALKKETGINNFPVLIRPMLESVISSTKSIIDNGISGDQRHKLSLAITQDVKNLSDVVENVLLMARIDSHRIEYCIENIRVADLIRGVYEGFCIQDGSQASSGEDRCRLSIVEGRPSLSISADILYMTRAIREIVKNAYSFSQKGDIFIGWSYHLGTNEVEIFVEDNGIGISLENQSSVFEVFCKEHETTGMGIGLSIAKELVENMGGKIVLVSHPGIGTRVSVLFQMVED